MHTRVQSGKSRWIPAIISVALLLLAGTVYASGSPQPAAVKRTMESQLGLLSRAAVGGSLNKWAFVSYSNKVLTTSKTLGNLPGMRIDFSPTSLGPILIQFCAQLTEEDGYDSAYIAPRLDGTALKPSQDIIFGPDEDKTQCFTWAKDSVATGAHTLKIKWSSKLGVNAGMTHRTLVVYYQ
jgi:hypothetical protein